MFPEPPIALVMVKTNTVDKIFIRSSAIKCSWNLLRMECQANEMFQRIDCLCVTLQRHSSYVERLLLRNTWIINVNIILHTKIHYARKS